MYEDALPRHNGGLMSQQVEIELIPVGPDFATEDHDLVAFSRSGMCDAALLRDAINWEKSELEIKWNAAEKVFFVQFSGKQPRIDFKTGELLSKRVPLKIARSSRCECGGALELGDYTVSIKNADFGFKAEYFCPTCKSKLTAERNGLKKFLETWFSSLKRVDIKLTGFGIERAVGGRPLRKT